MNCRFCGNFVPEGKDSCPVCGRRPEEEPIGKLLSENQPGAVATVPAEEEAAAKPAKKAPKGLLLPFIMIAASVLGWMYALLGDSAENFKSMWAQLTKSGTSLGSNSSFETPTPTTEASGTILYIVIAAAITLVGVVGIVWLFKRLYNRIKYRDQ